MEYTIKELSKLVGITSRTLRYYDEINLLKPLYLNNSGYRIYGENEIDLLQIILFYRALDVPLETIKTILSSENFNRKKILKEHRKTLIEKRENLNLIIENLEETIKSIDKEITMSNKNKFKGLKDTLIKENEKNYGKEAREKYGDDSVNASVKKYGNMTEEEFTKFMDLQEEINLKLSQAMKTNDPSCDFSQEVAHLHKEWLGYTWTFYSKEAHAGLAQMYVDDERFTAFYDTACGIGAAEFLRDIINIFTSTT